MHNERTATGAELARAFSITPRRVRQLRDEGAFRQLPGGSYDVEECERALSVIRSGRGSAAMSLVYRDADELALEIERDLARLAKRPQEDRLDAAMADHGVGEKVGKLIHLLSLMAATAPEGAQREFEKSHVASLHGVLLGSLLNAIGAELEPEARGGTIELSGPGHRVPQNARRDFAERRGRIKKASSGAEQQAIHGRRRNDL